MSQNLNYQNENPDEFNNDFDIQLIKNFFIRNFKMISSFSLIFFFFACVLSFAFKRVWQGQFQIVLNNDENPKKILANEYYMKSVFGINQSNNLRTQVGILESPSLLLPIYDFVISKKKLESEKYRFPYLKWRENLDIDLKRNTSILNISYRDTDKDLILEVLNKMTSAYQDYSGKNKRRTQELSKEYLLKQISLFKKKSSNSLKEAQEFALNYDLIFSENKNRSAGFVNPLNNLNNLNRDNSDSFIISNTGIEKLRAEAANAIRKINFQISKIEEIGDDYQELQYIGSTIPALVEEGLPTVLAEIEEKLVEARSLYQEEDKEIIRLIDRRELLIDLLKNRSISYLKAKKIEAEAVLQSAKRPKGTLLKYKELIRQAGRDESTLVSLENDLRMVELEQAKLEDPWELITMPTLEGSPVAPSRKAIGLLGLGVGFLIGILYSFNKEKKSGKIYDSKVIENLLSVIEIGNININDNMDLNNDILFLSEYINNENSKTIYLITLDKNAFELANKLKENLINKCKVKKEIILSLNLENINTPNNSDRLLLVPSLVSTKIEDLVKFKSKLEILKWYLSGYVLIKN